MLPARADWPPNNFTPRRLLSLSRPLRDEPPAFLCAMSNYFAFGLFLAAALAGAAFFVDAVFGLGAAFLAAGFSAPASFALAGAGFSVGLPAVSSALCSSAVASAVSFARAAADLSAPAFGASVFGAASAFGAAASALLGAGFFSAL